MSSSRQSLTSSSGANAGSEQDNPSWENDIRAFAKHLRSQRPSFFRAVARDAIVYAFHRGEPQMIRTKWRRILYALVLPLRASEYFALILYRLRVVLLRVHVPLLPGVLNWACALGWGIRIDNHVVLDEGIYIAHGEMVIAGMTYIGKSCFLSPFTSIGLVQGEYRGPHFEEGVFVGTGARILGPVRVGYGARVGANAVVLIDVPAGATAVGVPARVISSGPSIDNEEPPCVSA